MTTDIDTDPPESYTCPTCGSEYDSIDDANVTEHNPTSRYLPTVITCEDCDDQVCRTCWEYHSYYYEMETDDNGDPICIDCNTPDCDICGRRADPDYALTDDNGGVYCDRDCQLQGLAKARGERRHRCYRCGTYNDHVSVRNDTYLCDCAAYGMRHRYVIMFARPILSIPCTIVDDYGDQHQTIRTVTAPALTA